MVPDETIRVLKESIGKTVQLTLSDGESLVALVLNVDDEGFVYDLVPKEETEYWTAFDGVLEIRPLE